MAGPPGDLAFHGRFVLASVVSLVIQSLAYGIYIMLLLLAIYSLLKRPRSTYSRRLILAAMLTTFLLSTSYLAVQTTSVVEFIRIWLADSRDLAIDMVTPLVNVLAVCANSTLVLGDVIVVWRARTLCRLEYPKALGLSIGWLGITALAVIANIVTNLIKFAVYKGVDAHAVTWAINIFNVTTFTSSFLTNALATGVIGHKTWIHGLLVEKDRTQAKKSTPVQRILILLIDSGLIYCGLGLVELIFQFIHLQNVGRTLGDLFGPVYTQLTVIYPTLVVVLIDLQLVLENDQAQPSAETDYLTSIHIECNTAQSLSTVGPGEIPPM